MELYQLIGLTLGVVLLFVVPYLPAFFFRIILIISAYLSFEIFFFVFKWAFVDPPGVSSYRRSLASFGINIGEIVVFFAVAYLALGCIKSPAGRITALYSSLRTVVTIGPSHTYEPPDSCLCGTLIMVEIVIAFFLIIIVVASVVGSLRKL